MEITLVFFPQKKTSYAKSFLYVQRHAQALEVEITKYDGTRKNAQKQKALLNNRA